MTNDYQTKEAVLRIGQVIEVSGRRIFVRVDRNKNVSDLLFDGQILRNVSVNGYIEIRKGFLSLVGKVEGERVDEVTPNDNASVSHFDKNRRVLTIALVGFINKDGQFQGGTRELPLIGNEAFLVTSERIHQIHKLASDGNITVSIGKTDYEEYPMEFPVDGLFNSHIAIFGNTGSGKSNTLATLFGSFVQALSKRNNEAFRSKCRFLLFDFNGEYAHDECITGQKKVFNLSTRNMAGDKLPISQQSLLDVELLSILADATEKTQKPFLGRALSLFHHVVDGKENDDAVEHFRNILRQRVTLILQMSDKIRVDLLFDYLREILPEKDAAGTPVELAEDIEWHNVQQEFKLRGGGQIFLKSSPDRIPDTIAYKQVSEFTFNQNLLTNLISFMYLQLIGDVLANRAQNEHIAPVINKLKSKRADIEKILQTDGTGELWEENFVVINLHDVNLEMKKTIPLLVAKKEYQDHKKRPDCSLSMIIDEAHNILSTESTREAESWKDYRLETFEEIIKEGRKFGVFVTIASQRPSDISPTITSQAHNYFIHRLINQKDLSTIASAVSYIDQLSEASIPTLPTGTCIFSGTAGQMPLKLVVPRLEGGKRPQSGTLEFSAIIPAASGD